MRRVLVLCHGNMCRSPAVQAVLEAEGKGIEVRSAGFKISSKRAAKKVRDAMADRGFDLEKHEPRLVDPADLAWADIVLYMDNGNKKRLDLQLGLLTASFPNSPPPRTENLGESPRTENLGEYINLNKIEDPAFIKASLPMFQVIMDDIVRASRAFLKKEKFA